MIAWVIRLAVPACYSPELVGAIYSKQAFCFVLLQPLPILGAPCFLASPSPARISIQYKAITIAIITDPQTFTEQLPRS